MSNDTNLIGQILCQKKFRWLVTGAAGFIGSNLIEALLRHGQTVTALDNFITGFKANIENVRQTVGAEAASRLTFIEGDIRDPNTCAQACRDVDYVLHQAAMGSVPRSLETPELTHACNVNGFFNMIDASRRAGVKNFVYASSSSVYGDNPDLPKLEDKVGKPLSPYALTKKINEQYAAVFGLTYDLKTIGLRYFNVFGPRQSPTGPYAAVIPLWIDALRAGKPVTIFGDGETSRDFCFIQNVVQANIRAAITENTEAFGQVFNVAVGQGTTLNQLHDRIRDLVAGNLPGARDLKPIYKDFRKGDIRHSLADTSKIQSLLGYRPTHELGAGLIETIGWFS